ncbi:MAG TPA: hypothetical protein VGK49_00090, partial [Ilumatobacteraceae bacterium]
LDEAYRAFASDPEDPPDVFTALFTAEDDAADLIAELDRPIRTATIAGVVAGLLLSTAGAIFLLRRYRTEHRLMAADGDAAARFFGRALAQYAAPAFAGALLGVAFAWLVIEISGPSGRADLETVPWPLVIAVSVFAWGLASLVTAVAAVRLTDALDVDVGAIRTTWLALLLGAVVVMWVQVGQADHSETIDASTIALPLAGILAGVVLTVVLLRVLLHALRRTGRRLPTPLFLAWRALTASESGALVLTAALVLATGLAVLSATFVDSIDTAVELKTSTAVGAASRLEAIDRVDPAVVPAGSTIIRTLTTEARTAAGDAVTVDVLAIDPDTFAGAVDWPDEFGGTADDLVERLSDDGGVVVPVVIVEGRSLGSSGEFGGERVFPYESVGTVRSTPLASADHPTIVVRTDTFETVARRRWENGLEGVDPVEIEVAEALGREIEYVPPLTSFGNTIVSRQPIEVLTALGEQEGWRVREAVSAAEEVRSIDVAASRWGFEYLRILSTIAGVVALTALAFYLTERRAQREVSTVMTEQMGISRTTNVLAAIAEVVGLVAASLAVGVVTAIVTARRVFPVLEPSPDLAPTVGLTVDPVQLLGLAGIVIIAVSIAAAWAQRAASAAQKAAVLRG